MSFHHFFHCGFKGFSALTVVDDFTHFRVPKFLPQKEILVLQTVLIKQKKHIILDVTLLKEAKILHKIGNSIQKASQRTFF